MTTSTTNTPTVTASATNAGSSVLGFPFPAGFAWCKGGGHIASLSDLVAREGGRYCASHLPADSEPPREFVPLEADYETAAVIAYVVARWNRRHRARAEHLRWMVATGRLTGDTEAVELTDEERDRLSRHVLP